MSVRIARLAFRYLIAAVILFVAGYRLIVAEAAAQTDFYRGKTLTMVIGYSAGGGYDVFARLLAQHLGHHIPGNPTVVTENRPGAGSRSAGMYLYQVAPKDGTVIGTIGRNEAVAPLIEANAKFDGSRFSWIGSIADDDSICLAWKGSKIQSWQDMQSHEFTAGALAPGDNTVTVSLALRNLFGAKIKLVTGYPGAQDLFLALQRGEVEGACGVSWRPILTQHKDWILEKKMKVLVEVALDRDPSLGDVPLITDFVQDPNELKVLSLLIATQAMARPFLAPPDIPPERKEILRKAFDETMKDPAFLADANKASLYVHPMTGAAIDELLKALYATPHALIEEAAKAIQE